MSAEHRYVVCGASKICTGLLQESASSYLGKVLPGLSWRGQVDGKMLRVGCAISKVG